MGGGVLESKEQDLNSLDRGSERGATARSVRGIALVATPDGLEMLGPTYPS